MPLMSSGPPAERLRAVLDTNVLLSAFLSDRAAPAQIYKAVQRGVFQFVTSVSLLEEFERVLVEKFELPSILAHRQRLRVERRAEVVLLHTTIDRFPKGHGDNLVLATALDGHAAYLVTGDEKHLLPLKQIDKCRIVSPRAFLNLLQETA